MRIPRIALGIRAQLLLVLTVFLSLPWLGYEYVRALERVLRDAQQQAIAGTAQAVATALHERPRLFDVRVVSPVTLADGRARDAERTPDAEAANGDSTRPTPHPGAVAEVEQILQGLSRTSARIWVIDRNLNVLARAGSLKQTPPPDEPVGRVEAAVRVVERTLLRPLYALWLSQPTEDFSDEGGARTLGDAREIDGALAGILTIDRRPTADGRATIVTAAHPIWNGDEVRGAVIVEETTNRVLAERNRAFERLFTIVIAVLLVGTVALTLFASRLSTRIRALRDDAERAIDAQGRLAADPQRPLAGASAGDEIGDLARSFASALARLSQYASYQRNMASRLSHELRTPVAVVRSSLDNLAQQPVGADARVALERAQGGLDRLSQILTRMTEATRLEQSLTAHERERFDLAALVTSCVDGYRLAYPGRSIVLQTVGGTLDVDGAPDLAAQMLDKLVANAVEFAAAGTSIVVGVDASEGAARLSIDNEGPPLPEGMQSRLFDSMVSVRREAVGDVPHLGLGLYIARLIAEFHGGRAHAQNRADGGGVIVTIVMPLARER
jgi:dedicated sortase system histidine kinase